MEVFPDAKVVLTARDPETWYDSFMLLVRINEIYAKHNQPTNSPICGPKGTVVKNDNAGYLAV